MASDHSNSTHRSRGAQEIIQASGARNRPGKFPDLVSTESRMLPFIVSNLPACAPQRTRIQGRAPRPWTHPSIPLGQGDRTLDEATVTPVGDAGVAESDQGALSHSRERCGPVLPETGQHTAHVAPAVDTHSAWPAGCGPPWRVRQGTAPSGGCHAGERIDGFLSALGEPRAEHPPDQTLSAPSRPPSLIDDWTDALGTDQAGLQYKPRAPGLKRRRIMTFSRAAGCLHCKVEKLGADRFPRLRLITFVYDELIAPTEERSPRRA
jgi:hypothetical protein